MKRGIGYKIDGSEGFVDGVRAIEENKVKIEDIDDFFSENNNCVKKAYERIIDII